MRALALIEPGRAEVIEVSAPQAGPDDVLVRIRGVGICGSDLSVFEGHREVPPAPWVMGHEGVGEIVAVGSAVAGRQVGERVVIEPNYCCMHCIPCQAGQTSGCLNRRIVGINVPGLLAELVAVPAEFAWPAPDGLAYEELVCMEPYTVGVAAAKRAQVQTGQQALVVGAGSTGLLLMIHLGQLGVATWFVEPASERADVALRLGAVEAPAGTDTLFAQVFETSGTVSGTKTAIARAAPGASVTLLGLASEPVEVVPSTIVRNRLTIRGSMIYEHPEDFAAALGSPPPGLARIMNGRFELADGQKALESARGIAGKSWIEFGDLGGQR